jgi:hypothetical protein
VRLATATVLQQVLLFRLFTALHPSSGFNQQLASAKVAVPHIGGKALKSAACSMNCCTKKTKQQLFMQHTPD